MGDVNSKTIVLLGIAIFPLLPLLHIFLINLTNHKFAFIFSMIIYLFLWIIFLINIKFKLENLIVGLSTIGFFLIGYIEFLFLINRGFSLRILVEVYKNPSINMKELENLYSDGEGIRWLVKKRLNGMASLNLIDVNDVMKLKPLGYIGAWFGRLMKSILNLR